MESFDLWKNRSSDASITKGNLTEATSNVLTITGGTNAVIGSGLTIQIKEANTQVNGYITNTAFSSFVPQAYGSMNQPSLFYGITGLVTGSNMSHVTFVNNATADRLSIDAGHAGRYRCSFTASTGSNAAAFYYLAVYLNNVFYGSGLVATYGSGTTVVGNCGSDIIIMEDNEYIDCRIKSESDGSVISIYNFNMTLSKVGR